MDLNKTPAKVQSERACLCVLCGLPASGKSTLAQAVKTLTGQQHWRSSVISYDNLIPDYAFHSKTVEGYEDMVQRQTKWRLYRQAILQCVEHILQNPQALELPPTTCQINSFALRQCVYAVRATEPKTHQTPLILLLDDNFYYRSMRYEVYQLARKYSIGFCQVYLHSPVESCIDRNQRRLQALPNEVIVAMAQRMEPPNPEKNPWEQSSISLDTKDSFTDKALQRLKELISIALDNPLSPVQDNTEQKVADSLICANSVVHQADQACRHRVSQAMQKARENKMSPDHMRSLAAELNKAKTTFLQNLRKKVLQDIPITPRETIDGESVAKRALDVFDQDTKEIMARFLLI
ncbi:L-seryl-tRNA(Sec) kinase [Hypomesus transpacificus]|uniref:L-seryl-tRNA(Sec) kinase n=1 Tax=Hypomesus transpacificus TaxID=137520 RepID=UPI001F07BD24|nr:L-seryl-tRNA(Sec) kinase [Hypomesus transpacificus]